MTQIYILSIQEIKLQPDIHRPGIDSEGWRIIRGIYGILTGDLTLH